MKKKVLSLFLVFLLAVFSVFPAFAEGTSSDVATFDNPISISDASSAENSDALSGSSSETDPPVSSPESIPADSTEPDSSEITPDSSSSPESISPQKPDQPEAPTPEAVPVTLSIDSAHIYGDMDRAFENGYSPKIVNHQALFTLPLKSSGPLKDDRITVSLEFGPGGEKAFLAASYEKDFSLTQLVPNNGSSTENIFLASFSVQMLTERINGVYPVTAHIRAQDLAGAPVVLDYTVFVTVSDGRSGEPPKEPQPEPEKPTAEPVVYIQKSVVSPVDVQAGEPFTVTLTLKNSVRHKSVRNLLVTVDTGDLKIDLLEESNVFPVESIKAGGTAELMLHCKAQPSIEAGKHPLNFTFQYNSSESLNLSSQGLCMLNVRQKSELSYDGARLPQKVTAESTVSVQTNLMNTGKSVLYNCRVEPAIDGLDAGGSAFIGEIKPGESKTASLNLRVSDTKLGQASGTLTIYYEDDYGEVFTKSAEISTTIVPKPEPPAKEEPEKSGSTGLWWLFILIGLALGGGIGFGIPLLIKDARQRKDDDLKL